MQDPRIPKLARQLVRYSTKIKRGENVLIDVYDTPDELAIALVREVRAVKAEPFVNVHHARISRELSRSATSINSSSPAVSYIYAPSITSTSATLWQDRGVIVEFER